MSTEKDYVSKMGVEMLKQQLIRPYNRSWDASVVLVPKKDGKYVYF
jgi:hypothetical protein